MKKLLTVVAVLLVAACSGCVSLEDRNPLVIRVIEYGAGITGAQVGGCSIHQAESEASAAGKGSVAFVLKYQGERCAAQVQSK